jgi:hypothetical protein
LRSGMSSYRATASFKLVHIEIEEGRVDRDARQAQTNITLWWLPSLHWVIGRHRYTMQWVV